MNNSSNTDENPKGKSRPNPRIPDKIVINACDEVKRSINANLKDIPALRSDFEALELDLSSVSSEIKMFRNEMKLLHTTFHEVEQALVTCRRALDDSHQISKELIEMKAQLSFVSNRYDQIQYDLSPHLMNVQFLMGKARVEHGFVQDNGVDDVPNATNNEGGVNNIN